MPSNTKNPNYSQAAQEARKLTQPLLSNAQKKIAREMAKKRITVGGKIAATTPIVRKMPIPAPAQKTVKKY